MALIQVLEDGIPSMLTAAAVVLRGCSAGFLNTATTVLSAAPIFGPAGEKDRVSI